MLTYCLKCQKNTKNTDAKVIRTKMVCGMLKIRIYERTRSRRIVI